MDALLRQALDAFPKLAAILCPSRLRATCDASWDLTVTRTESASSGVNGAHCKGQRSVAHDAKGGHLLSRRPKLRHTVRDYSGATDEHK